MAKKAEKLENRGTAGIPSLFIAKPSITRIDISDSKSRAMQFLEQLKAANEELETSIQNGINKNIEVLSDDNEQHIEMELDLGVFDIQIEGENAAANENMIQEL